MAFKTALCSESQKLRYVPELKGTYRLSQNNWDEIDSQDCFSFMNILSGDFLLLVNVHPSRLNEGENFAGPTKMTDLNIQRKDSFTILCYPFRYEIKLERNYIESVKC